MQFIASAVRNLMEVSQLSHVARASKGQTMGEYALILAAVALVAYAGFQVLGVDINGMMNSLGGNL